MNLSGSDRDGSAGAAAGVYQLIPEELHYKANYVIADVLAVMLQQQTAGPCLL